MNKDVITDVKVFEDILSSKYAKNLNLKQLEYSEYGKVTDSICLNNT